MTLANHYIDRCRANLFHISLESSITLASNLTRILEFEIVVRLRVGHNICFGRLESRPVAEGMCSWAQLIRLQTCGLNFKYGFYKLKYVASFYLNNFCDYCWAMGNQCFASANAAKDNSNDSEFKFTVIHDARTSRKTSSVCAIDWNSESSVKHRSAINCLHNYAIGKIACDMEECNTDIQRRPPKEKIQRSASSQLRFSSELCEEKIIEREFLCTDNGRDLDPSNDEFERIMPSYADLEKQDKDCCIYVHPSPRAMADKPNKRGKGDPLDCCSAWERRKFSESAPDFAEYQLFKSFSMGSDDNPMADSVG